MNLFKKVRDFFRGKPKKQGLVIQKLPDIDPRTPIVEAPALIIEARVKTEEEKASMDNYLKCCSVCKFAIHDENLEDMESIICTLNPNKPETKQIDDTCLSQEPKYKNLKVIVDKGTLLEYDSEKAKTKAQPILGHENAYQEIGLQEVGEKEWLQ